MKSIFYGKALLVIYVSFVNNFARVRQAKIVNNFDYPLFQPVFN